MLPSLLNGETVRNIHDSKYTGKQQFKNPIYSQEAAQGSRLGSESKGQKINRTLEEGTGLNTSQDDMPGVRSKFSGLGAYDDSYFGNDLRKSQRLRNELPTHGDQLHIDYYKFGVVSPSDPLQRSDTRAHSLLLEAGLNRLKS